MRPGWWTRLVWLTGLCYKQRSIQVFCSSYSPIHSVGLLAYLYFPISCLTYMQQHEVEGLIAPIERRMWKLERRGPRWKQPSLSQVLANVPFLSSVPQGALEWFRCDHHYSDRLVNMMGYLIRTLGAKVSFLSVRSPFPRV